MSDRYQEALEKAKELLETVVRNNNGRLIPNSLVAITWDTQKICQERGDDSGKILPELKKQLRQAYYIAVARNDYVNVNVIKEYYFKCFEEEVW